MNVSEFLQYNENTQMEMICTALNGFKKKIDNLEKFMGALEAALQEQGHGPVTEGRKASSVLNPQRVELMAKYPGFEETSKIPTFEKHERILNGEPKKSSLERWFKQGGDWNLTSNQFIALTDSVPEVARAFLYFMRISGMIDWDTESKRYVLPKKDTTVPVSETA